jgi:hypothetical protein
MTWSRHDDSTETYCLDKLSVVSGDQTPMPDPPRYPESGDDRVVEFSTTRTPLRSKLVVAVFAVLILVVVILHLTGRIGPGLHSP